MTDLRLLPDVELIVQAVLNDVDASSRTPDNLASRLPRRAVYKIGGKAVHPRFLDAPQVQVASYAATRDAAVALAETARVLLFNAWRSQVRTPAGVIHRVVEVLSPTEIRTGTEPDGVFRVDATYQIFTRP